MSWGQVAGSLMSVVTVVNLVIGFWAMVTQAKVTTTPKNGFAQINFEQGRGSTVRLVVSEMP
ncbi:MAG: hypothetical protein HY075_11230 [Deltaproteobacteria bacterium]|nr:hypothetical protein [Deltaproteobacteria bacterium]